MAISVPIRRNCEKRPDSFCYICGSFTIPSQRTNISTFVRQAYFAYFKVKLGDQDKAWAPHKVCKQCVEGLRMWTKGTRAKLPFGIPMIWREPKDHSSDCYFCIVKTSGYNKKNKCKIEYPSLPSAIRPVPHSAEVPVPVFNEFPSLEEGEYGYGADKSDSNNEDFDIKDDSVRKGFEQQELNDLVRDLGLSKEASELLASRLNEKNLLDRGAKVSFFRTRERRKIDMGLGNYSSALSTGGPSKSSSSKKKKPSSKTSKSSSHPQLPTIQQPSLSDGHLTSEEVERHLENHPRFLEIDKASVTIPNDMFSNDPSLDSESNEICEMETSPSNLGEDCLNSGEYILPD